ncbi:MAG: hypothetical protein AABY22_00960 [Nanoarchaeota archaeon]
MIKNPTEEQLSSIRYIVYIVQNMITYQGYTGQTEKTFNGRYGAKWWKYITTRYLKGAIKKYGVHNFQITILACNIRSERKGYS